MDTKKVMLMFGIVLLVIILPPLVESSETVVFTSTEADGWIVPENVDSLEVLVVAGGGGGASRESYYQGGGGAGGFNL